MIKVIFFAPLFPIGFWIAYRGFYRRSELAAMIQIGSGGLIFGLAYYLIFLA